MLIVILLILYVGLLSISIVGFAKAKKAGNIDLVARHLKSLAIASTIILLFVSNVLFWIGLITAFVLPRSTYRKLAEKLIR